MRCVSENVLQYSIASGACLQCVLMVVARAGFLSALLFPFDVHMQAAEFNGKWMFDVTGEVAAAEAAGAEDP